LAAGGMQSIEIVTFAFGSSGADGSDDPLDALLESSSLLLLVPQEASEVRASAVTRAAAEARLIRRVRRNPALLIDDPLWA
jgi:hypothetical protein